MAEHLSRVHKAMALLLSTTLKRGKKKELERRNAWELWKPLYSPERQLRETLLLEVTKTQQAVLTPTVGVLGRLKNGQEFVFSLTREHQK